MPPSTSEIEEAGIKEIFLISTDRSLRYSGKEMGNGVDSPF
jgi:hypothetical protein